ncbi:MCE family protein [Rhodococcus triatomae]|uniref:Virulence factor Mce family protein n=1 Tax=Rhodococcus triatomae TaxID=300028 RepID=A0A1G7ZT40_9NOCA|nr:MCE family protein [Rhodococcus triatomae]QNG17955.1 MCE family protein [Rhodococcus triatomae]QNG22377.1 MCE family protein [Rhodococcus triatomae]SDH11882.1 virulence factor Mce family protein [Rhodococcus triatomae]
MRIREGRGGSRRGVHALLGAGSVLAAAAVYVFAFSLGSDVYVTRADVAVTVPAEAGALRTGSSVLYRGVEVGRVSAIDAATTSSLVTLGMDPGRLDRVPHDVQVRLMPRTVFGDYFVDLVDPPGRSESVRSLVAGDLLTPDRSDDALQLYQAFSTVYDLVSAVRPADLNVALTAVATALQGRGERIGESLETLRQLLVEAAPTIDRLGDDLDDVAMLTRQVSSAAPDLLRTLHDSITVSTTIVEKQDGLRGVLAAGAVTAEQVAGFTADNRERVITLVSDTAALGGALTAEPDRLSEIYEGLRTLVTDLPPALGQGPWLSTSLKLTVQDLRPYWREECPRYGETPGASCDRTAPHPFAHLLHPEVYGGASGPVGSPTERAQIEGVLGDGDLGGILGGPILRGTTVVN